MCILKLCQKLILLASAPNESSLFGLIWVNIKRIKSNRVNIKLNRVESELN